MRISIKMLGLLAVLALAMGFVFQGTAQADPPDPFPQPGDGDTTITVDTEALVTGEGSGQAPVINYKWENVDMDRAAGVFAYFDADGYADDDPTNAILDFWPWLGDDPEARLVRYWAAVHDPNGLDNIHEVWVNVYHPDESLKYKLHMDPVACSEVGSYDPQTHVVTLGEPLEAAVQTGQLTQGEAEDLVVQCYNEGKRIYRVEGDVSKEQPAGEYQVEVFARDKQGNLSDPEVNSFTVISIVGLVIDFADGVDFGEILPGEEKVVVGDQDLNTPGAPTVQNIGNDPMYLWLHWYPMVGRDQPQPMDITTFDAMFKGEKLYFDASVQRGFCNPLSSNEYRKLDLSVDPPDIVFADTYIGSLDVMGAHQADPECPRSP